MLRPAAFVIVLLCNMCEVDAFISGIRVGTSQAARNSVCFARSGRGGARSPGFVSIPYRMVATAADGDESLAGAAAAMAEGNIDEAKGLLKKARQAYFEVRQPCRWMR